VPTTDTTTTSLAGLPNGARADTVATGLDAPWDVAVAPDGRLWVSERDTGQVEVIGTDGTTQVAARLPAVPAGEGGLLGLAVSPTFATDGELYAYFTAGTDNRVVRFRPGGDIRAVLTGIPKAAIHNGGRIAFGPDGKLYVGTGDAGESDQAQDPQSLAGKILRLEPDGSVPADNPTAGSPVYSLGHRNVQGLAWDEQGRLWATEFGPDRDDELNLILAGGNYGWPEVTGRNGAGRFEDPTVVLQPGDASPSGLTLVRGPAAGAWNGDLMFGALRGQRVWRAEPAADGRTARAEDLLTGSLGRVRTVVAAPDGTLLVVSNNTDGRGSPRPGDDRIVRITPPPS
jgi:glucose/arabinose dehydrogenase